MHQSCFCSFALAEMHLQQQVSIKSLLVQRSNPRPRETIKPKILHDYQPGELQLLSEMSLTYYW